METHNVEYNLIEKSEQDHYDSRYCGLCKKQFSFGSVIKIYPTIIQETIMRLWKSKDIEFYCSYCLLLKLIKKIKSNKNIR